MALKHEEDIQLCESCGRYLYLSDSTKPAAPEGPAKPKPARKARSPKKSCPLEPNADPGIALAIDDLNRGRRARCFGSVPGEKRRGHQRRSFLDEVTQVFQFDGEVDVVDHDLLGHGKDDRRKIQNARDAGANQLVGNFLRGGGRHGENGHFDALFSGQNSGSSSMPKIGCLIFLSRFRRGSASNAATISNPSFSKPRYDSSARPRLPTPTRMTGCRRDVPSSSAIFLESSATS